MFVDGESILVVSSKGTYDVDRRIGSLSYMPLSIAPSGRQGRDIDVILGIARFQTEQFRESLAHRIAYPIPFIVPALCNNLSSQFSLLL